MKTILADGRGRITLGERIIAEHGKKFMIVSSKKQVILVPISNDPLKRLRELAKGSGIHKYSVSELKTIARKQAEKEV